VAVEAEEQAVTDDAEMQLDQREPLESNIK